MKNLYSPLDIEFNTFFQYRLGMNKTYAISLTAMDEDDDAIKCRHSQWVEAGSRLTSHKFWNANVDAVSFRRSSISESFVKKTSSSVSEI